MPEHADLRRFFSALGLDEWGTLLVPLLKERMSDSYHGDFTRWRTALEQLRAANNVGERRESLLKLAPWRKGPFDVGGVHIDAEWRSDIKWNRLQGVVASLAGRNVLDVGCGNGYYALRMRDAGARHVIGIDPTLLYVMQFLALRLFDKAGDVHILPLRLQELPQNSRAFDTTFSMGVLYHQRSPIEHLQQLRASLRPGGQLVLETLFLPGEQAYASTPPDRYARMRNVWLLPTIAELTTWLSRCGYRDIEIVDTTRTTVDEQRSTEWMTFESLADALAADDSTVTVEGWPAPRRVVVVAISP